MKTLHLENLSCIVSPGSESRDVNLLTCSEHALASLVTFKTQIFMLICDAIDVNKAQRTRRRKTTFVFMLYRLLVQVIRAISILID